MRALASLARVYENAHDLERGRATLNKALKIAETATERAELYWRLGRLEAEEGGDEAAEPLFRKGLAEDPHHPPSLKALEAIARQRGDWLLLVEVLIAEEGTVDPAAQRAYYLELATLLTDRLRDTRRAQPYLEKAVALAPEDPAVLEPLADLYFASGRLDEAATLYRSLVERLQKTRRMKDVARLRARLGAIAEQRGESG